MTNVCILGLWHLGSVTAACVADAGHQVIGCDPDDSVIANLQEGQPPLFEPGLSELIKQGLDSGKLRFTTDPEEAVATADVIWVTFDTPVNQDDQADVAAVTDQVERIFPYLSDGSLVLISSQLPVGTAAQLENAYVNHHNPANIAFATSPENLRLGNAIENFKSPDRIVVGVRDENSQQIITELLTPITDRIEWMSVESAEMVKHALNAFLATSVSFANEIAVLCENVGADAKEVERGLKTEERIGPQAYLRPGGAFSGGTLARDVNFLGELSVKYHLEAHLLRSVRTSNEAHKGWAIRRLTDILGSIKDANVAMLGLTYKPGTDTLRRSLALDTAQRLHMLHQTTLHAHDPVVKALPKEYRSYITLHTTVEGALSEAEAVIISTPWQDYRQLDPSLFSGKIVLDASAFLIGLVGNRSDVRYYSVGMPDKPAT